MESPHGRDQNYQLQQKATKNIAMAQNQQSLQRHDSKFRLAIQSVQNFDARIEKDKQKKERQLIYREHQKEMEYLKQVKEYKNRLLKQWKSADNSSPIRQFNKNFAPKAKIKVQNQKSGERSEGDRLARKLDSDELAPRSIVRIQIPSVEQGAVEYQLLTEDTQNVHNNTNDDQMFILQQNQLTKCGESLLNSGSDQVSERPLEPAQLKLDSLQSESQSDENTLLNIGLYQNNANSAVNLQEQSPLAKVSGGASDEAEQSGLEMTKILAADLQKMVEKPLANRSKKRDYRVNLSPKFQIFSQDLLEGSDPVLNQSLHQKDLKSNQYIDKYFPLQKKIRNNFQVIGNTTTTTGDDQLDEIIGGNYSAPISELEKNNSPESYKEQQNHHYYKSPQHNQQPLPQNIFPKILDNQYNTINKEDQTDINFANIRLKNRTQMVSNRFFKPQSMKKHLSPQNRQFKILQDLKKQVQAMSASVAIDSIIQSKDGTLNEKSLRESLDLVSTIKKNSISTLITTRPLETVALNGRLAKKLKKEEEHVSSGGKVSTLQKRPTKMMFHVPSPLEQHDTEQTASFSGKKGGQQVMQPRILRVQMLKSTDFGGKQFQTLELSRNNDYSQKNNVSREQQKSKNKSIFQKLDGHSINKDLNIFTNQSYGPIKKTSKKDTMFGYQQQTIDQLPNASKEFELKSPGKNQIAELASEDSSVQFTKLGNYSNYSHELHSFSTQNQVNQIQQKVGGLFVSNTNEMPLKKRTSQLGGANASNDTITEQELTSTVREGLFTFGQSPMSATKHNQKFLVKVQHKKSDDRLQGVQELPNQDLPMGQNVGHNQYLNGQMGNFNLDLLKKFDQSQIKFFLGGYKCVQHQRQLADKKSKQLGSLKNSRNQGIGYRFEGKNDTMLAARGTQYLLKDHQLIDESCASESYGKSQKDYFEFEDQNHQAGNQSIKVNLRAVVKNEYNTDVLRTRQNSDLGVLLDPQNNFVDTKPNSKQYRRQSQSNNSSIVIQNDQIKSVKKDSERLLSYDDSKNGSFSQKQLNKQHMTLKDNANKLSEGIDSQIHRDDQYDENADYQRQTPKSTLFNSPGKGGLQNNQSPHILQFGYTQVQPNTYQEIINPLGNQKIIINDGIQSSTIQLKRSKAVLSKVNLSLKEKRKSQLRSSNFSLSQKSKENISNIESQQTSIKNAMKFKMNPKVPLASGDNQIVTGGKVIKSSQRYATNHSYDQSQQQHSFLTQIKSSREDRNDSGTFIQVSPGEFEKQRKSNKKLSQVKQPILVQYNEKKFIQSLEQSTEKVKQEDSFPDTNGQEGKPTRFEKLTQVDDKMETPGIVTDVKHYRQVEPQVKKVKTRQLNFDLSMNGRGSPLSQVLKEDQTDLLSPFSHDLLEYSPRLKITPYRKIEQLESQLLRQVPPIRPIKLNVVDINQKMDEQNIKGITSTGQLPFLPIPQQNQIDFSALRNQLGPSSSTKSLIKNGSNPNLGISVENVSKSWNFDERLRPYMQIQGLFQGIQSPIEQFENRRIITGQNLAELDPQPSGYQSRQLLHDMDEGGELLTMRGIYEVVNQSLEGTSNQVNILKNNMSITSDSAGQQSYPRPNFDQRKKINERYNQIQKLLRLKQQSSKNSMRMSSVYSSIFKTQDETTSQVCKSQHARSIYEDQMTDNNSQTDTAFVINKSDNQINDSLLEIGKHSVLQQINSILSPSTMQRDRSKEDSPDQVGSTEVELLAANESFKEVPKEMTNVK